LHLVAKHHHEGISGDSMYAANRSINQRNALIQKIEFDINRTERKLAMYFGPLARLDQEIQSQADLGNLLECQIQYVNIAMSAGADINFNALYDDYVAALEKVKEQLIERYRHALLYKENTAEAEELSEENRKELLHEYKLILQNLMAPFYDFQLNAEAKFAELFEAKKADYNACEAIIDEIYERKKPITTALYEEGQIYTQRREQYVEKSLQSIKHPLIQACEQGDLEQVETLLKLHSNGWFRLGQSKVKAYINAAHEENFYVLHVLIKDYKNDPVCSLKGERWIIRDKKNRVAIAELLLKNGANRQQLTADNYTPLHLAAKHGHAGLAKVLLENGCKANVVAAGADKGNNRTPLHMAAFNGHIDVVSLLLKHNANMHAVTIKEDGGKTALHEACAMGHLDIVRLLVANGAHVNALDVGGNAVLAYVENSKIALYLLDKGALATMEQGQNSLDTLLKRAQSRRNDDLMQVLIDHGVRLRDRELTHVMNEKIASNSLGQQRQPAKENYLEELQRQKQEELEAYKKELEERYSIEEAAFQHDTTQHDTTTHFDRLDHTVQQHIFSWLNYKSLATATTVSKYWYQLIHSDNLKQFGVSLVTIDDINDAKNYMNEQREQCEDLLSEGLTEKWRVIHIKPMLHNTDWAVTLCKQDKTQTLCLSSNVLINYAQRYRYSLTHEPSNFHTISLN
jgi:hypothetical protein